jgi:y4mF family transcriptional regulator
MNKEKGNTLSLFVKEKRKQIKITQIELADKAGVGLRFVRDMEQGKTSLRMDKVNDVLKLFGAELTPNNMDRNKLINNE